MLIEGTGKVMALLVLGKGRGQESNQCCQGPTNSGSGGSGLGLNWIGEGEMTIMLIGDLVGSNMHFQRIIICLFEDV
jgi:hypothetical protein